ncbi:MAG: recombinase family protein [Candidatus Paceibacterota bacterium]
MSAKAVGRPVFNELVKMIVLGKADAILCWKLDRLARNFIDGGLVIDSLQRSVIKEIRTYESIHLPSDNVLMLAVQLGMANQYIRDLSVNVKRGNREKLSRGGWPNHAPFGYLNNKADKTIVIDPIRAKYVLRTYELYLSGTHGLRDIEKILYEEGLRSKSGKRVLINQIHRILSSPFYTGLMVRDGKYYEGKHEPIISKETFDRAQDILNDKARPKSKTLFFPLRGFLRCGNCGCALTSSLKKGHHYYYCTNGKKICTEHKTYLREVKLYSVLSEIFGHLDFTERKIELMYQSAKERTGIDSTYSERIIDGLQTSLESLKPKESRILDTFLAEQISKELYDQKSLAMQNERIALTKQLKEAQSKQTAVALEPIKEVFLTASRAKKEFLDGDDAKKHTILKNLLWNLSIKDKKVASLKLKDVFEVMRKAPKTDDISTLLAFSG